MKKNIILLVAATAFLASCASGGSNPAHEAPTVKEEAQLADVKAAAKKAVEVATNAQGASLSSGMSYDIKSKIVMPGENLGMQQESVTLNEKVNASIDIEEAVAIKDSKFVGSGKVDVKVNAELDAPVMPDLSALYSEAAAGKSVEMPEITIKTGSKLDLNLSGKDYLQDGKVYLDGTGAYDGIMAAFDFVKGLNYPVELPDIKKDELKVYFDLPAGLPTLDENFFKNLGGLSDMIDGLQEIPAEYASFIQIAKFSDGSFGFTCDLKKVVDGFLPKESIPFDLSNLSGKFTVTIAESGKVAAYLEVAGKIAYSPIEGTSLEFELNAKLSAELNFGAVTVETLSDTTGYKQIETPKL